MTKHTEAFLDGSTVTFHLPPKYEGAGTLKFLCLYGSHAHGTATASSDEDWRGVFQLSTNVILGLARMKTTHEVKAEDQVYWELAHFANLLLKGNPNLVGMLFAPNDCIHVSSPVIQELIKMRQDFITEPMVQAYIGWVHREMRDLQKLHKIPAKRLSHVPRLLWELEGALLNGEIQVRPSPDRMEVIMAIKTGVMDTDEAVGFCGNLLLDVERLREQIGTLHPGPVEALNRLILEARYGIWDNY